MNHIIIRILAALLTFTLGIVFTKLLTPNHRLEHYFVNVEINKASESTPTAPKVLEPKRAAQSITFSANGAVSAFQPYYSSSDGVHLRYGCFEFESPASAARYLREEMVGKRIIDRMSKVNDKGERIGDRAAVVYQLGSETETKIIWTEGARFYLIRSPSLKHALLFEESQVWASDDYCANVRR